MADHDLLVLWTQLAALLFIARGLGALAGRLGQPAVAGELAAGLLLGPSVFGHAWPGGFRWLVPSAGGSPSLQALVSISLAGLLVSIGAETDLPLIRRLGSAAAWVSGLSLLVPLAAGAALSLALPADLLGPHGGRAVFAVLVAGAVAVSSLPVIAKIVGDLGLVRRNIGQLAIATGTVHDATGFVLVALATGMVGSSGSGHVVMALLGVAGVSVAALTVGQWAFDRTLRWSRRNGPNVAGSLTVCVVGSLAAAAAMQAFGVEGALGAFVAGVALGRSRFQVGRAVSVLQSMTTTVFAPLYFSAAGLRVDLGVLGRSGVAVSFMVLLAVAVVAKLVGTGFGALAARLPRREVVALGVLLNGRGALQVVIATAGLSAGVLTTASYTVIILLSVVTSLSVPPLLGLTLSGWQGTAEERDRLECEEQLASNVVVRGSRLLLATRGSDSSIVAAEVLHCAWPAGTAVTVLGVEGHAKVEAAMGAIGDVLHDHPLEARMIGPQGVAERVLAEANLGYGAVVVGAGEDRSGRHLLSPVVDELLMRSPLPVVIVRPARDQPGVLPAAFARALVPVSGTPPSRAGQEIACNMGASLGTHVVLAHVVTRSDGDRADAEGALVAAAQGAPARRDAAGGEGPPPRRGRPGDGPRLPGDGPRLPGDGPRPPGRRSVTAAEGAARVVLRGAWETAMAAGVDADVMVAHGNSAGEGILDAARRIGADVLALGTTVRHVEGRPFLGHTVEQILARSAATVVVVALPDQAARLGSVLADAAV